MVHWNSSPPISDIRDWAQSVAAWSLGRLSRDHGFGQLPPSTLMKATIEPIDTHKRLLLPSRDDIRMQVVVNGELS